MILYGYTWKPSLPITTFTDFPTSLNPIFVNCFGYEDQFIVSSDIETDRFGLHWLVMFDHFEIISDEETKRLLAFTSNQLSNINLFDAKSSWYAKPAMNEIARNWFVQVMPDDIVSFYYVHLVEDTNIKTMYPYPIVYDQVSKKDYVIPGRSFKNTSSKFCSIRSFVHCFKDTVIDLPDNVVMFVDGFQSDTISKGVHRVDWYLEPDAEVQFPDTLSFMPPTTVVTLPLSRTSVSITNTKEAIFRLRTPCYFDFCRLIVDGSEVPILHLGELVYFKYNGTPTEIYIYQERPRNILKFDEIYNVDYIIDVDYKVENAIVIAGFDFTPGIDCQIVSYDPRGYIEIKFNWEGKFRLPLPGEYFTVFTDNLPGVRFTVVYVDSRNLPEIIVRGERE